MVMRRVLSLTGVLPPGSVVTETYVILGAYDSESEARNCLSYCHNEVLSFSCCGENFRAGPTAGRILIRANTASFTNGGLTRTYTQNTALTADEIAFIESTIRPMNLDDADDE